MKKYFINSMLITIFYLICDAVVAYIDFFNFIREICYCSNYINSTLGVYLLRLLYIFLVNTAIFLIAFLFYKKIYKRHASVKEMYITIFIIIFFGIYDIWTSLHHGFIGNIPMLISISNIFSGYIFITVFTNGFEQIVSSEQN